MQTSSTQPKMLTPDLVQILLANSQTTPNLWNFQGNLQNFPFSSGFGLNPPLFGGNFMQFPPQQLHLPPTVSETTVIPSAVTQDLPIEIKKEPIPDVPSTSSNTNVKNEEIDEKSVNFEMGKLPTSTYYPTHFMRGTQLHVANGKIKKVEDLCSDDFLKSASLSNEVTVNASVVKGIKNTGASVTVVFETGGDREKIPLKCQVEHPFFVLGKGWSSCNPRKTGENYGLDCELLELEDVCVVLTRKNDEKTENAIDILTAERDSDHFSKKAAWGEQIAEIYYEHVSGRVSAPPERILMNPPMSKRQRLYSE